MAFNTNNSNRIKHIPKPAIIIGVIGLIVVLIGTSTWLVLRGMSSIGIGVPGPIVTTPTPIQVKVPATTHDTPVSPLLFGTNMALFDNKDQVLNSGTTRAALQQLHVRIIRMPVRSSLPEATEIQAAQAIKSMGATPLVILRGQVDKNTLADDMLIIKDMNSIFGNSIVYYEYGNEEDLLGVPVDRYTASWNNIVPQLKRSAQNGHFIGPVNYQYDHNYLATFLQNAQPRPDEVSWHEYTCDDAAATDLCISHIDNWTKHIASARSAMVSTIGSALPIMITEWNYSPNAVANDGKNNNSTFMNTWTTKALQTLAANRIFASMQYSCTNTSIPLITNNGTITTQGSMLQTQYNNIIISGHQPAPPNVTDQPQPNATAVTGPMGSGKQGFTFDDGSTDGWSSNDKAITNLQNSNAPGINGKHALQVTIGTLASTDYPSVVVGTSNLTSYPKAGQTLSADVYLASNSVSLMAKVLVVDSNYKWNGANLVTLTPGTWTHLTYTLPGSINGAPLQIGIQFNSSVGNTISTDVYINAVNWG